MDAPSNGDVFIYGQFCNFQRSTSHLAHFTYNRIGLGHLIPVILFQLEELSKEFFSRGLDII